MLIFVAGCLLLLLILALYLRGIPKWYEDCQCLDKIPGPKDYPIIGNWTQIKIDPESLFNYDRQRAVQYYPIYRIKFLYRHVVSILCPEDMEAILSNAVHNNKSLFYNFLTNWLGTGLLLSNGTKWHERRKILTPAFHFSILQEFIDIFNRETKVLTQFLEENCHNEYIDIIKPVTDFALQSIAETSLGVSINGSSTERYRSAIHKCGFLTQDRLIKPWMHFNYLYSKTQHYKKFEENVNILHNFSKNIITERKQYWNSIDKTSGTYSKRKRLALLDLMLKVSEDNGKIDDEGIREEVDTFMFEGHDTTSLALCYILLTLAAEPDYQEKIQEEINSVLGYSDTIPTYNDLCEMKFMERCIKECLRLYPSVPVISRVIGETFVSHSGYTIPKGTPIFMYIYDLHRNSKIWEDPERFDPDRFLPENVAKRNPFTYLPFSAGGRNCIGQKFAMLELKAVLCGIFRKFSLQAVDKRSDLRFKVDLVLRPVNDKIRIKFVPRM